mmetsp:Transcript_10056/g.14762  ORF Transcript_10056/g.14762 Transcript_10056/m.14762 type:complete len:120 (-) Transcript_10056:303-662(-)|eukprot:CAMPEP_0194211348 /NCGR_PEP_ID=MMETSP0156-20130528/10134_1 /TAXON_ID=33649 /ORGANISM="Thalassionema nitzschioides, Strain L26-B" /LENGTH=119 /DNA_ID=CAMNT_0038938871 /DNA_START=41 /DNA_END=400 /DNA_ORIENTATION=-
MSSDSSLPSSVQIQVLGLKTDNNDVAAVVVYLHDKRMGCGPPAKTVGSATITPNNAEEESVVTVVELDYSEASYDKMIEPSLYAALNIAESTVTYQEGTSPAFSISGSGKLYVQPKNAS